jgi:recombination protein RecT
MSTSHLKAAAAASTKESNPPLEILLQAKNRMSSILPDHLTYERMSALSLGCLRTNEQLRVAAMGSPDSFMNSVLLACRMGLEPGIDAHLVPYKNTRTGKFEVQCIPDYRGLLKLARNSGEVADISCHLVYENDTFELSLGLTTTVKHSPELRGDRGEIYLGYAVAKMVNGAHHVEWMTVESINRIRDNSPGYAFAKSKGWKKTPWIEQYEEMCRKTVLRRLCKYLPMSPQMNAAQTVLDAEDRGSKAQYDPDNDVTTSTYNDDESLPEITIELPEADNAVQDMREVR